MAATEALFPNGVPHEKVPALVQWAMDTTAFINRMRE